MNWLSSILVAVIAGLISLFLAGLIANACVSWYHVSSREGAAGYFVLFTAIGGGVAGFIIALISSGVVAAHYGPSFLKQLGVATSIVVLLGGAAAVLCRVLADVPPTIEGEELNVAVEFRFPAKTNRTQPPTADGEWKVWLGSLAGHTQRASRSGEMRSSAAELREGRWVVPAEVFLFTERGKRTIALQKDGEDAAGFLLPLPARPGKSFEQWSEWLPRQSVDGQPWPADKMSYRFRIQKRMPPPPPPGYEEVLAEQDAKEEAEFAAIGADAPIRHLLPYLQKKRQKDRALSNVLNRPELPLELAELALGQDPEEAAAGLRLIALHPHPTAALITPVELAGRDLAARIQKVNATTVDADPSYLGAADVSIRFNGWMEAARKLRTSCGGDFTSELREILELSRVRGDSYVMQTDVCRVASFYLHEWAGIPPLPTDPKPR